MQINAYDKCLSANSEKPDECVQVLKELYFCTEATSLRYRDQEKEKQEAAAKKDQIWNMNKLCLYIWDVELQVYFIQAALSKHGYLLHLFECTSQIASFPF